MSDVRPVVLIGEALAVLNGPPDRPISCGTALGLTYAGAELNVAIGLARLGHSARWLSMLGEDPFGNMIERALRGEGVDVSGIQRSGRGPTAMMVKNRRAGGEPEVFYYRRGSAMSQATSEAFASKTWSDARTLYVSGITPALSSTCREMVDQTVAAARAEGIEVWLDPNHRRKLWSDEEAKRTLLGLIPHTAMVLVGLSEGLMLTGSDDPRRIADALLASGARAVIVKAGTSGAYYTDGKEQIDVPAFPIERVVDAIGAGDGFAAGVLSAKLEGLSWHDAMKRGNAVGAMVCMTQGDWEGLPTRRELEDFLSQRGEAVR